ncbi:hypothetical protein [Desulfosarcina cetonica]|uniref:hypothetical protein n=1 Tax=Desulfosarcina cetonica TaxID=90730 RepID=UPI001FEFAA8B|nr:hypothetical protein [Desulfosarcina cetonica]
MESGTAAVNAARAQVAATEAGIATAYAQIEGADFSIELPTPPFNVFRPISLTALSRLRGMVECNTASPNRVRSSVEGAGF